MVVNYSEHGFSVYAEILPEACTACPFWGYCAGTNTGVCGITGTEIEANGVQDERRMDDCCIQQYDERKSPVKRGKWITNGGIDICSVCGASRTNQLYDDFCGKCGAKMEADDG